jgi:hypothetical protein
MTDRAIRRAAAVTGCGLAVELVGALHWTPATFVLSAAVGAPLVLVGAGLFLRAVWRIMKERGAA